MQFIVNETHISTEKHRTILCVNKFVNGKTSCHSDKKDMRMERQKFTSTIL